MEGSHTFSGERKLADFLKLSEDLFTFLHNQIKQRKLRKSMIQESTSGKLTITLEYHQIVDKKCHKNDIAISRDRHFDVSRKPASSKFSSKKKTPSRKRRDQERFRLFLEKKRQRKQRKVQHVTQPTPVQCPPPPENVITVSAPSPVTIGTPPSITAPAELESLPPCSCDVCSIFVDSVPYSDLYSECHNCGKPTTEQSPLKPCAQCLAYCSRE